MQIQLAGIEIVVDALMATPIIAPPAGKRGAWIELRVFGATRSANALDAVREESLRIAGAHIAAATFELRTYTIADDRAIGALANAAIAANLSRRAADVLAGPIIPANWRRAVIRWALAIRRVATFGNAGVRAIRTRAAAPPRFQRAADFVRAAELIVLTEIVVVAVAIRVAPRPHAGAGLEVLAVRIVTAFRHAGV